MARTTRGESKSPYHHILVEGSAERNIFQAPEDKEKLLEIMERVLEVIEVELYAYCIMPNHAHFVLRETTGDLSRFMKRINGTYASYYNRKYGERGQVFYDRFKSESIGDMEQLLRVMRFVHNNPVSSGYVPKQCDYPWSSYRLYIEDREDHLLPKHRVLIFFASEEQDALKRFVWYMMEKNTDIYLDLEESIEKRIRSMIDAYLRKIPIDLDELGYKENTVHRDRLIQLVRASGGLSIRKIGELLQLNRGTVYNVISRGEKRAEERTD